MRDVSSAQIASVAMGPDTSLVVEVASSGVATPSDATSATVEVSRTTPP